MNEKMNIEIHLLIYKKSYLKITKLPWYTYIFKKEI